MSTPTSVKRAAAALGVLFLVAAMLPACAAMCCVAQPAAASRMMAAMPCCANTPSVHSPRGSSGLQNATLTASPKSPAPVVVAAIAPAIVVAPALTAITADHLQPDSAVTTPAFLRNEQFRI